MENRDTLETGFEKFLKERVTNGWAYQGKEQLTITKFNSKNGLFEDVPFQTEEDIVRKYKGSDENTEVDLVFTPNERIKRMQEILSPEEFANLEITPRDKSYFVFIRKKG